MPSSEMMWLEYTDDYIQSAIFITSLTTASEQSLIFGLVNVWDGPSIRVTHTATANDLPIMFHDIKVGDNPAYLVRL